MHLSRQLHIVNAHTEGEVGNGIVGGVLDVRRETMYEKMIYFWNNHDHIRQLLLNEPRGRSSICVNLLLAPCDPKADAGFLIMEAEEWAAMSGSNVMCVTTVLLETGIIPMKEPVTNLKLDTAAGLVSVRAACEQG